MSLSDIPIEQAKDIIAQRKITNPNSFCAKCQDDYMENRLYYENILRNEFLKKGGKLYLYGEILEIIKKYGLPQEWNKDGEFGPERYIEVHIWSDRTIKRYL